MHRTCESTAPEASASSDASRPTQSCRPATSRESLALGSRRSAYSRDANTPMLARPRSLEMTAADADRTMRIPMSASPRARSATRDSDMSSMLRAGCFAFKRASKDTRGRTNPSLRETRTVPDTSSSRTARTSDASPSSSCSASATSCSASASTRVPPLPRCTSTRPRLRSIASTRRAMVEAATPSVRPAAKKLLSRWTASKKRRSSHDGCCIFIFAKPCSHVRSLDRKRMVAVQYAHVTLPSPRPSSSERCPRGSERRQWTEAERQRLSVMRSTSWR